MLVATEDFAHSKSRRAVSKNCTVLDQGLVGKVAIGNEDRRARADGEGDNRAELGVEGTNDVLEFGEGFAKP